jgi:hypothetical protein
VILCPYPVTTPSTASPCRPWANSRVRVRLHHPHEGLRFVSGPFRKVIGSHRPPPRAFVGAVSMVLARRPVRVETKVLSTRDCSP